MVADNFLATLAGPAVYTREKLKGDVHACKPPRVPVLTPPCSAIPTVCLNELSCFPGIATEPHRLVITAWHRIVLAYIAESSETWQEKRKEGSPIQIRRKHKPDHFSPDYTASTSSSTKENRNKLDPADARLNCDIASHKPPTCVLYTS